MSRRRFGSSRAGGPESRRLDSVLRLVYPYGRKKAVMLNGDLVADGSVPYEHGWVAYRDFGGQVQR